MKVKELMHLKKPNPNRNRSERRFIDRLSNRSGFEANQLKQSIKIPHAKRGKR